MTTHERQFSFAPLRKSFAKTLALMLFVMMMFTLLVPVALAATPERADLLRFIPTTIDVSDDEVVVGGYFVNLNSEYSVSDFKEVEMDIYKDDDLLVTGYFGTLHSFTIKPLRVKYQSFKFNGSHDLNNGSYVAHDNYYCMFSCKFSSGKVS